jgi:hypothetical protein
MDDDKQQLELDLIMPSEGDMTLSDQEGGKIVLSPIFYGNESMGPHIVVRDGDKVIHRYKLRIKSDGRLELKKGQ